MSKVGRQDEADDLDKPIWGAKAIGNEAGVDERKAFYMLERGYLDGTKCGVLWVSTPRRIRRSLGSEVA
jgi:hypothetical protein